MKTKVFLFVNKDAKSNRLTQSGSLQSAAIQRHVQTDRPRPRKKRVKFSKEEGLQDEKAVRGLPIRSTSCKSDPFNASSVPIDSTVRGLLQYYVHFYHPSVWTYGPSYYSNGPYAFKKSVVQIVNTAIEDSLTLYCLLSAAASRVHHVDAFPFLEARSKEPYFMQQALRLMQERIDTERPTTMFAESLLTCVQLLGAAEAYKGDFIAARMHLKAALTIMEPMGGVMQVKDKNLQGQILMADLALACFTLEPCVFDCSYDPGPGSVLELTEAEAPCLIQNIGFGMALLSKERGITTSPLRSAVAQTLESYRIHSSLRTESMSPERAFEITHWVTKRNMAIRRRLLALQCPDDRTRALRTALVMWTLLAMNITGRVKTVKVMASKLIHILVPIAADQWSGDEDMKLWILLIGYSCAKEDSETCDWFVQEISALCALWRNLLLPMPGNADILKGLIWFQRGFLYHEPVQRAHAEKLAVLLAWSENGSL